MRLFQLGIVLAWIVITAVTVTAFRDSGLGAAVEVFSADLAAGNWRTQFNSDLLVHLALIGLWAAWRERFSARGIVAGLCCAFGGSLFSFAYIFVLTITSRGDTRQLLLGRQAAA